MPKYRNKGSNKDKQAIKAYKDIATEYNGKNSW